MDYTAIKGCYSELSTSSSCSPLPLPHTHLRYHLGYVLFCVQGVGMILPYNAFITATNYFEAKFTGSRYEVGQNVCGKQAE